MANMLANIFGSSPVKPLEKHIDISYRCARELRGFFAATVKGDWSKARKVRAEIERLEHEADILGRFVPDVGQQRQLAGIQQVGDLLAALSRPRAEDPRRPAVRRAEVVDDLVVTAEVDDVRHRLRDDGPRDEQQEEDGRHDRSVAEGVRRLRARRRA